MFRLRFAVFFFFFLAHFISALCSYRSESNSTLRDFTVYFAFHQQCNAFHVSLHHMVIRHAFFSNTFCCSFTIPLIRCDDINGSLFLARLHPSLQPNNNRISVFLEDNSVWDFVVVDFILLLLLPHFTSS